MATTLLSAALDPSMRVFNAPFIVSLPTTWTVLLIEAATLFPQYPGWVLSIPFIAGIFSLLTAGPAILHMCFAFTLFIRLKRRGNGLPLDTPYGMVMKAVVVAASLAASFSTLLVVGRPTSNVVVLWLSFPFFHAIVQAPALQLLHDSRPRTPPHIASQNTVLLRRLLVFTASVPFIPHIALVHTIVTSPDPLETLKDAILPYPHVFQYRSVEELLAVGLLNEAKRFLQWSALSIYAVTWMAGAWGWAFSSVLGLCKAIVVSLVGGVLFGPGVFVAYPYLVQMRKDEEARQVWAEELLVDEKL